MPPLRDALADDICRLNGQVEVLTKQLSNLIPEQSFNWLSKNERLLAWAKHKLESSHMPIPRLPSDLDLKDRVIALFDYVDAPLSDKLESMIFLKKKWTAQQLCDKQFAWYASASKEKEKCQIAWEWYQTHHKAQAMPTMLFEKRDDLLQFLDGTPFSLDEKLYHLEQIKKRFKALEVAASRKGKRQTNLSLSSDVRQKLDTLSKRERMTRTELVELLIEKAYKDSILG